MSDDTKIEWTDATWNPITGCSVLSAGCTNCYAMRLAGGRLRHHPSRAGLTRESGGRQVWTGEVRFNKQWLDEPLRWRRPRRVFVCAHGDLFHENVPDEWIDRVFAVMALAPQHTFQVLTKRARRAQSYLQRAFAQWLNSPEDIADRLLNVVEQSSENIGIIDSTEWPLPNVWLGVSVEDQDTANERIPILLDTPAALRWVSAEPLLGLVGLRRPDFYDRGHGRGWIGRDDGSAARGPTLDWVVAGGESGPAARPSHPEWFRSLRDQCADASVPFLFKQWGEWAPGLSGGDYVHEVFGCSTFQSRASGKDTHRFDGGTGHCAVRLGKRKTGRALDGVVHDAFPKEAA